MTQPRIFLPTIGDFVENYEIQGKLGEGAFGNVYLVKDSAGSKKALKLLKLWRSSCNARDAASRR